MDPRPLPRPSALTAPYWEACQRGELAVQRCRGCGRRVHLPEPACPYCGGTDLPYETVSGRGSVHTFSVVHRAFLPGFEVPYVIAWIDLEEGVRAFGGVVGDISPEDVRIGMPVRVRFDDLPGFGRIPNWRPA
ncbi:Zn-ribbon domain-containing OB-fold protein [Actinoallomurus rhizosphaericola]|uniref:Zn-ribbon domain-containing OB-fold protein n=1 Tax=Actinoallomurus rhizosphaericola TaxID=2952536 RepID=UPI002090C4EA|nr:OB-fold domain-containing protein [Actinoallomurus rhizosphaericola]MCO5992252.1 OB-fold domain-containing protein [Actinoallomurus rhizosphaericola]